MLCWKRTEQGSFTPNPSVSKRVTLEIVADGRRDGIPVSSNANINDSIEKHEKTQEEIDIIKEAIRNNEFLSNILTDDKITQIAEAMYPEDVRENEVIIQEGDNGSQMYVSQSGVYTIHVRNEKVGSFSDHKVFGELAILYKAKRLATIRSVTKGKIWVIHRDVYQKILVGDAKRWEDELISFLKKVPNVNKLSDGKLKTVMQIFKTEFFPPDHVIVTEGDVGDKFYIIRAGAATVTREIMGKVADLGKGDFFGERALLQPDERRQATVTAKNQGVECLTLTRNQFLEYFDANVFEAGSRDNSITLESVPVEKVFAEMKLDDFTRCATLGVGGFGRVELVQHREKKEVVFALKYLKKADVVTQNQIPHAYNEKDIQIKCNSIFIVRLYKTFKDNKYLYFLMEACMGGDLWTLMGKQKGRKFTESAAKFYTACVVEAFSYLHDRQCVYRDLKPENLLLDSRGYLKLTDFGFAKSIGTRLTYTFAGTPEYVAPEIIYNRGHDRSADYWALGIFIYELLAGRTPFKSNDPSHMKTYQMILRGISYAVFPKWMSNQSIEIVRKLCKTNPAERLGYLKKKGANEVRQHEWFRGFDWQKLRERKLKPPFPPKLSSNVDTRYFEKYGVDNDIPPDDLDVWDSNF